MEVDLKTDIEEELKVFLQGKRKRKGIWGIKWKFVMKSLLKTNCRNCMTGEDDWFTIATRRYFNNLHCVQCECKFCLCPECRTIANCKTRIKVAGSATCDNNMMMTMGICSSCSICCGDHLHASPCEDLNIDVLYKYSAKVKHEMGQDQYNKLIHVEHVLLKEIQNTLIHTLITVRSDEIELPNDIFKLIGQYASETELPEHLFVQIPARVIRLPLEITRWLAGKRCFDYA